LETALNMDGCGDGVQGEALAVAEENTANEELGT
jgi:hypothetical protein